MYLGKKYDRAFTSASEALGTPVVQHFDEASAEAMWSNANVNVVHGSAANHMEAFEVPFW